MRSQKARSTGDQSTSLVRALHIHRLTHAPFSVAGLLSIPLLPAPPDVPHCNKRIRVPPSPPDHRDSAHPVRSDTSPECAAVPDQVLRTVPTPSGSVPHPPRLPPRMHSMRTQRRTSTPLSHVPLPPDRRRKCGSPPAAVPAPAATRETPEYRRFHP